MDGLEVTAHKTFSEDDRGRILRLCLSEPAVEVVVVERKRGTISGDHYHKGLDESKNPEKLFVVKGKVKFEAKNLSTGEEFSQVIGPLTELRIHPNVYHKVEALEDIILIEVNKTSGMKGDVFRLEE